MQQFPADVIADDESRRADQLNRTRSPPLVKEWDLKEFQENSNVSLARVFHHTSSGRLSSTYQPLFTVINCDAYKRRDRLRIKHRGTTEFLNFLAILESLGARLTVLASAQPSQGIPILFESHDPQLNHDISRDWKKNERNHGRRPRDIFSERFIADILGSGKVPDLNQFRVGETDFYPYDANNLLTGRIRWEYLRRL